MTQLTVTIDKARTREITRIFKNYPTEVPRLYRDAINRTATKARKAIVDRLAAVQPSLKKKDIRKNTTIDKATTEVPQASVNIGGKAIPLIDLGAKIGRKTKFVELASARQSAWLFYNFFKRKYGANAVFSYRYKITRNVHQNITYKDGKYTKSLAGTGAFVATMRSGHKGIFKRRYANSRRIVEMKGPSVSQMLERSGLVATRIQADAMKNLEMEIDKRVVSYLARAQKRRAG